MQLLYGNKRTAVSGAAKAGVWSTLAMLQAANSYDENKPKEPAPPQVTVMFAPSTHSCFAQIGRSLCWRFWSSTLPLRSMMPPCRATSSSALIEAEGLRLAGLLPSD
jgi:hypothetical protein